MENQLKKTFDELEITEEEKSSLSARLNLVKERDIPTYNHSIRVGLKGVEISEFIHEDPKILLYAGLLHDIGKSLTDPDSLKKTDDFNGKDMDELKKHPSRGYEMLRGIRDFIAEIVLRHHQYGEDGYPKQLPKAKVSFSKSELVMIGYFSRLLALVDFYDSLLYRKNGKFSSNCRTKKVNRKEARGILSECNPDKEYFINELYGAKIFK